MDIPNVNPAVESIDSHFNQIIVTLTGYCTDQDTDIMTLLMKNFSQKFSKHFLLRCPASGELKNGKRERVPKDNQFSELHKSLD